MTRPNVPARKAKTEIEMEERQDEENVVEERRK